MDAGLKRDVPSFEDSGGEFSVVKDLTPLLYAKCKKSQVRCARKEGDMLEVPGIMPIRHRSRGGVGVWAVVCLGRGSLA